MPGSNAQHAGDELADRDARGNHPPGEVVRGFGLRHTAATTLRAKYGVEAAKVILGHTKVKTSQIYAERDLDKAEKIMAEIG